MKIGISAEWVGEKVGGPETYDYNLIKALGEIDSTNDYYIYLNSNRFEGWIEDHKNFSLHQFKFHSRWITIPFSLPWELLKRPVDIFHATFVASPFCLTKYVLTVHDIAWEIHPEWVPSTVRYRLSMLMSRGVAKAAKVLAASEATKNDLVKVYGLDEKKIEVMYYGVGKQFKNIKDTKIIEDTLKNKYKIDKDYLLFVGRFHIRKNLERLLRAFSIVKKEMKTDLKLVLIGTKLWDSKPLSKVIHDLRLQEDIVYLGYVQDEDLPVLYNGAKVFLFPSLFEGFGLPPLEAMACGTPALVSNSTSLPEVVGDAAILVDPYNVDEIANGMYRLLSDEGLRKLLINRGFSRASMFSWEETARKTLKVYEEVLSRS